MQVIFIPIENDEHALETYVKREHANWLMLKYGTENETCTRRLKRAYHVTTIPKLIIVQDDGTVLTYRGRKELEEYESGVLQAWKHDVQRRRSK